MSFYNGITTILYMLFLPARMNAMYYNRIHKNILAAKETSNDRVSQLAILRKVGGTNSSIKWLLAILILVGILAAVALPAYQDYTRRAQVATGFILGSEAANKVGNYYATQQRGPDDLVKAGFSLVPTETVRDITFNNQTGVLTVLFQDGFFSDKSLLLVPDVVDKKLVWLCTSDGVAKQHLPPACKATQDAANERLAAIKSESETKAQARAEYAQAVAAAEQQYPELNPDSPSQNQQAMDWVLARKAAYEKRGDTATNALQSAVVDYGAALQQQRSQAYPTGEISNSTQQVRRTGGISQSEASRTLCETWPTACR